MYNSTMRCLLYQTPAYRVNTWKPCKRSQLNNCSIGSAILTMTTAAYVPDVMSSCSGHFGIKANETQIRLVDITPEISI